jgi:acyl-CoA thioester hydrolase
MTQPDPIYRYPFTIPADALDANGHVNNVQYVQWMQNVAVHHFTALGGMEPTQALGATWVVRSHNIEYLNPAFVGEQIEMRTWVASLRRVRCLRRYEFVRLSDAKVLVRGATEWIFVEAKTGRPLSIPPEVEQLFPLLPDQV